MSKKIFIVTGEPSGDNHASYVVKELKKLMPDIEIEAVGGHALKSEGVKLLHDHSEMAVIGLDSFKKIPEHLKLGANILTHLQTKFAADLVLLIDYGGFNLRLARHLKANNFKIFYYVAPQVWASRKGRLKKIARLIDKTMLIYPFEEEFYKKAGVNGEFVGNPLVSQLPAPLSREELCQKYDMDPTRPVVSLFPGSRKSEIRMILEAFVKTALIMKEQMPVIQFCLCQSVNIKDDYLLHYLKKSDPENKLNLKGLKNSNYDLLSGSDMVIVASGTITLEAAVYQTPMIISYISDWISYSVYLLIRYIYMVGLPNIIVNKKIVPEYVQLKARPKVMAEAALKFLNDTPERKKMLNDLADVKKTLTNKVASVRVAEIIYEELSK